MLRAALYFDAANHSESIKAAGVRISYDKLLENFGRTYHVVSARYYSGVDDTEAGRGVRDYLAAISNHGLSVIKKPVSRFDNGSIKANVDIEIAVDMIQMAPRLDKIFLFSGDGDFVYAVDAVQRMGVNVVVCSHKENTSIALRDQVNEFWDLKSIIKTYNY